MLCLISVEIQCKSILLNLGIIQLKLISFYCSQIRKKPAKQYVNAMPLFTTAAIHFNTIVVKSKPK